MIKKENGNDSFKKRTDLVTKDLPLSFTAGLVLNHNQSTQTLS
jgi:hypothetical protein